MSTVNELGVGPMVVMALPLGSINARSSGHGDPICWCVRTLYSRSAMAFKGLRIGRDRCVTAMGEPANDVRESPTGTLHGRMRVMRKISAIVMAVLALTLAGCTSSTAPAVTRAARQAAAAAVKAESAANAAAAAAERAEAAAEAAARAAATASSTAACTAGQLVVALGPSDAAMGHIGQVVSFKNISAKTCALEGYPGVKMLDAAGQPIPTEVTDGPSYIVPALPERVVVLTAGSKASFDVGYSDATGYGDAVCPTSVQVAVTPPSVGQPITVSWRIQPYGGSTIAKLQCGQIAVSPVYAGSGASAP